jgi:hypothetical protein
LSLQQQTEFRHLTTDIPPETSPSKPGPLDPSFLTLNLDEKLKMVEGCAHIHEDEADFILNDDQNQWNS